MAATVEQNQADRKVAELKEAKEKLKTATEELQSASDELAKNEVALTRLKAARDKAAEMQLQLDAESTRQLNNLELLHPGQVTAVYLLQDRRNQLQFQVNQLSGRLGAESAQRDIPVAERKSETTPPSQSMHSSAVQRRLAETKEKLAQAEQQHSQELGTLKQLMEDLKLVSPTAHASLKPAIEQSIAQQHESVCEAKARMTTLRQRIRDMLDTTADGRVSGPTMTKLLQKAVPHLCADECSEWAVKFYTDVDDSVVVHLLESQDLNWVRGLFNRLTQEPGTATLAALAKLDVRLGETIHGVSVFVGVMGDRPIVAKRLEYELPGYELMRQWQPEQLSSHRLMPFHWVEADRVAVGSRPRMQWVWMERQVQDLDHYPRPMTGASVGRLIRHMLVALQFLHQHGLAYMDVKPRNILMNGDGYLLTDYGSVVPLRGQLRCYTAAFRPVDMRRQVVASAELDWWLLAMTVMDMLVERSDDRLGRSGVRVDSRQVLDKLATLGENSEDVRQLIELLRSSGEALFHTEIVDTWK